MISLTKNKDSQMTQIIANAKRFPLKPWPRVPKNKQIVGFFSLRLGESTNVQKKEYGTYLLLEVEKGPSNSYLYWNHNSKMMITNMAINNTSPKRTPEHPTKVTVSLMVLFANGHGFPIYWIQRFLFGFLSLVHVTIDPSYQYDIRTMSLLSQDMVQILPSLKTYTKFFIAPWK